MDVTADLDAPVEAAAMYRWVADLERYPQWLEIVTRAVPAESDPADVGPAWFVQLRGKIGPLSRSKQLRMVRTVANEPHSVTFERRETDGQTHSPWVLRATIVHRDGNSHLAFVLHYGGGLFEPIVERLLRNEIDGARKRLAALVLTD
ncbi:MAG: SRPBCC family protein [Acidimicrobiales bacterium]